MKKYTTVPVPVILSAVNKMVGLIAPTYGPSNNKILIDVIYKKEAVDDGVTIAKEFELENEEENTVVEFIKETAVKTNSRVGDGTTTSLILLKAILDSVYKDIGEYAIAKPDNKQLITQLEIGAKEAVEELRKQAKPISTVSDLKRVCRMSFDNDIADLIAQTVFDTGKDGTITLEESETMETTMEKVEGFQIDRGYVSSYMATEENLNAVLENPYVLLYNTKIENFSELLPVLEKTTSTNKPIVLIAQDFGSDAINGIIINKLRGAKIIAIKAPGFSDSLANNLEDLAAVTGATVITEEKGLSLAIMELGELGSLKKIISTKDSSILIGNGRQTEIKNRIKQLKSIDSKSEFEKAKVKERIAKLAGGVAIIRIGAPTENEMIALKYKADDCLNAARAAIEHGVVRGAGLALFLKTSSTILNEALRIPHAQLVINTGITVPKLKTNEAINAITGEVGDYFDIGVIDPVAVLIAALESAVSTASILMSIKGIIAIKTEKKEDFNAPTT